jgi:hypothetical protein
VVGVEVAVEVVFGGGQVEQGVVELEVGLAAALLDPRAGAGREVRPEIQQGDGGAQGVGATPAGAAGGSEVAPDGDAVTAEAAGGSDGGVVTGGRDEVVGEHLAQGAHSLPQVGGQVGGVGVEQGGEQRRAGDGVGAALGEEGEQGDGIAQPGCHVLAVEQDGRLAERADDESWRLWVRSHRGGRGGPG